MNEDYRRDYEVSEIHGDDRRFIVAKKEALFTQVFFIAAIFLAFGAAYAISPENPEDMTYFMGWPLWLVVGSVIFIIATILITIYIILNGRKNKFALSAREEDDAK